MNQHYSVTVDFGGFKKDLKISNPATCSVLSALVETSRLFSGLAPHCKPITTKYLRTDDLVTKLSHYKYYSSLDLKGAYHQKDKPYAASEANGKLYQFHRVPFGVTNDFASFQRIIDSINNGFPDSLTRSNLLLPLTLFLLGPEAPKAIDDLKEESGKAVVGPIDEIIPLVAETEASDTAISATLNQAGRPVAFFSRTLTPTECKHSAAEKEAFAIVEFVKRWSHYLT
ncbi:uncharacterized protein LOC143030418 [Oratosquilla oratoria]|uniref:uncharacterized protein LOC143030418 n=1 Tax=Oratosquilla oratoria TaxID=337810 RepID=UPI003F76ECE8